MMNSRVSVISLFVLTIGLLACAGDGLVLDTDFDIPRTEAFPTELSNYDLFEGEMGRLEPSADVVLFEITSALFTDYAKKQRLVRLPDGEFIQYDGTDAPVFPNGTVLAKTFYFPFDYRDESAGRRIIETRLLVKTDGLWNSAAYVWNDEQTDATLMLSGATTTVEWISDAGETLSANYEIPSEVACVTCHQSNEVAAPLGLSFARLDREVERDGTIVAQLDYLLDRAVIPALDAGSLGTVAEYTDESESLERRARAYLHANCSHCHQPNAWSLSAEQGLDFRFSTSLADTGIPDEAAQIGRLLSNQRMPYIGTSVPHAEGIALVRAYIDNIENP